MERTIPNPPELVAPVHGAPVRGDTAKLVWKSAEGATAYHVQVATDADFTRLIVDTRLDDVTSLVIRRVLHGGEGSVFWRVAGIGPGGRGAFSEATEFVSSPAPAELPHAGLTAEAGAETDREAARHDPAPVRRQRTGRREFGIVVAVLLVTVVAVIVAFTAFPGLSGDDGATVVQRDSVSTALRVQQQRQREALQRYRADSTGYSIPIDSAIARMAEGEGAPFGP